MAKPLKEDEIKESLKSLNGWKHENDKLKKEYSFDDFREAMTFITRISFEAEDQVHHPEIFNVYNTVNIALTSHDAGDKVTNKDVKLAKTIETISNNFAS
jgi:4a-hydroxytetrahydrobiopterin dehydratase